MLTMLFLCRRRPDITHAAYAEMVLRDHVPLALRHHTTMRRYVVNLVEGTRPGVPELDSIAALSFDRMADYEERLCDSPEGARIIAADVARFMGSADAYATTTYVHRTVTPAPPLGTRTPGVKLVSPIVRRAGMSHDAFVDHWLERHVPLALRHHAGMTGYVTNVIDRRTSPTGQDYDGIAELHFPSPEAVATSMFDSPEGEAIIREDMDRFIGATVPYLCAEYVQRQPG